MKTYFVKWEGTVPSLDTFGVRFEWPVGGKSGAQWKLGGNFVQVWNEEKVNIERRRLGRLKGLAGSR
jgi:hypothetical protein